MSSNSARDRSGDALPHGLANRADCPGSAERPLIGRGDESFLDGVLGCAEIIAWTHHRTERLRRKLAQQALDTRIRRLAH